MSDSPTTQQPGTRKSRWPVVRWVAGLVLLYLVGLLVRHHVVNVQAARQDGNLPFTLEGALNFRRIEQVFMTGTLPVRDPQLEYPEGVVIRETDTVGEEYVYAALARLFPRRMPLADRIRWLEPAWFCMGIPLLSLWIWWWRRSRAGAIFAGGFYAVALSSVIRSTGQEVSHENFALPLLIGHLAFEALADDETRRSLFRWLAAGLSALLLVCALVTWDLIQFYVGMWMVYCAARFLRTARVGTPELDARWGLQFGALFVAGALNPYLRAHGFLAGPVMCLGYGMLLLAWIRRMTQRGGCAQWWSRPPVMLLLMLLPALAVMMLPGLARESYGHFGELLYAKIRFLNMKPADPSRLNFSQRIMWVPALDSANVALTMVLLPAMLPLSLVAAFLFLRRSHTQSGSKLKRLLFFYAISLVAFVLLVRFHVFLAVFASAILGVSAAWAWERGGWRKWVTAALLVAGMAVEGIHVVRQPERWGRTLVYYREIDELIRWLKGVRPEPVLANFGISASILTYGQCPIVLHPKFESQEIRTRVQDYGEQLFKGREEGFRDWADQYGVKYYVYAMGEFSPVAPQQQMRYFVNELDPSTNCPAWMFEYQPESLKYFRCLWGNRKYRVFRMTGREDEVRARQYARVAAEALEQGDLQRAEDNATSALLINPADAEAQRILKHVGVLSEQGFEYRSHETE